MALPTISSGTYKLVLEADAITGHVDGDAIGTWLDGSGNGNNATQGTGANQPLYKTAILNGLPVLRFDGTNDVLSVAGVTNNTAARTIYAVGKRNGISGTQRIYGFAGTSSLFDNSGAWGYFSSQTGTIVALGGDSTVFQTVALRFNSTSSCDSFVNAGVAVNFDPSDGYQSGTSPLQIGAEGDTLAFWTGDVASLIVVDGAVSTADHQAIVNYLGNKYGLATFPAPPTVSTDPASAITQTTATLNGTINPNGKATTYHFEYGLTTGYGTSTSSLSAGSGSSGVAETAAISGLTANTLYHYRVVATNSDGTTNGLDATFTTLPLAPPTVATLPASGIGNTSATLNATVNPNGKSTTAQFEWGLTTAYGTIVSLGTIGSDSSVHALSSALSSLTQGTTYHYRISATNADGTSVGSDVAFVPAAVAIPYVPAIKVGLWTFDLCDGAGVKLTTLSRAAGASLTFTRNGIPECSFSLAHEDDDCATLLAALKNGTGGGVPTLKGYRIGRDGTNVLRFNGYLASVSEESGVDASTATFTFQGPFGRVMGMPTLSAGDGAFTNTDAGSIAQALVVTYSSSFIYAPLAAIQATKTRTRNYALGQDTGQAIIDLSAVLDGFDFEVTPIDKAAQLGQFNVYAKQGADQPNAKFEYGPPTIANCSAMHRQTLPPVNSVLLAGANGLTSFVNDGISQARYGLYRIFQSAPDVSEQQTLDDKANAYLRPNPVKTLDFTPEPRLAPSPWDDYWIGDTVYFAANRGALVEGPIGVRVNQITVAIDPDTGLEASEIPNPETPDEAATIRAGLQTEVVVS